MSITRRPDAWLIFWHVTGLKTAYPGARPPPKYGNTEAKPLYLDATPDYEAAAEMLAMQFDGCPLRSLPDKDQEDHRRDARAIVNAAMGIKQ